MRVRKAKPFDAASCLSIALKDKEKHWRNKDFAIAAKDKGVTFLVAEDDGKIAGYVLGFIVPTKRSEALIHETRVDRDRRGMGIGTKLVDEFCKTIFSKGVKSIYAEIAEEHMKFYRDSAKFKHSNKWIEVAKHRK